MALVISSVLDQKTGVTQRVSVDSMGIEGNGPVNYAEYLNHSISADGRYVAFTSNASNLVAEDNNSSSDIFLRDLKTGVTQRVSVDNVGGEGNWNSYKPTVSGDGRYVAFTSDASNLVAEDNNNDGDIFVHDQKTGITKRISTDSAGIEGNNTSWAHSISANGRYVAFSSNASKLVVGDNNGTWDIFVRDLKTGVTQRVSVNSMGTEANDYSTDPSISANGRFVAFTSDANNLVARDNNGTSEGWAGGDVFVHDLKTDVTQRLSVDSKGTQSNSRSEGPTISANGRIVAFTSFASNLVAGDNNDSSDIFVRRRW